MRIAHHPALHTGELVAFLGRRAIAGVEEVRDGAGRHGLVRLGAEPAHGAALAKAWRPLHGFATAHLWAAAAAA